MIRHSVPAPFNFSSSVILFLQDRNGEIYKRSYGVTGSLSSVRAKGRGTTNECVLSLFLQRTYLKQVQIEFVTPLTTPTEDSPTAPIELDRKSTRLNSSN